MRYFWKNATEAGAAPQGDWGRNSPTPHKGHFCKSSLKPMRKHLGYGGRRWRHQPYLDFSLSCQKWLSKTES